LFKDESQAYFLITNTSDVGGQLCGVGSRDDVSGSDGVEEMLLAQPPSAIDDLLSHQGDGGGWPPEPDRPELQEEPRELR
jgi:hypothetical protein